MNKWIRLLILASTCLISFQSSAETLREAIRHTVATNPTVQEAATGRLASDYALRGAKGAYFPNLDLTAVYGREQSNNTTTRAVTGAKDTLTRRESGLELRQLIFDGFATPSEVARNKAIVESNACVVAADSNDVALRVTEAYVNMLRHKALVEAADNNLQTHYRIAKMIGQRTQSGITRKIGHSTS